MIRTILKNYSIDKSTIDVGSAIPNPKVEVDAIKLK